MRNRARVGARRPPRAAAAASRSGGAKSPAPAIISVDGFEHRVSRSAKRSPKSFRKANPSVARDRRHLRHRRRLSEVLPRRDRHQRRVAADQRRRNRGLQEGRAIEFIELPIAYDGIAIVVNPKNTWATSITVAELKTLWEPEAQGKVTALEPGPPGLAGSRDSPLRRRRRLRHLRLLHRGDQRQGKAQPRRLHVERRRQRPRAGHQQRRARARLHSASRTTKRTRTS